LSDLSYAAEQVRLYDHDRFLTVIFAQRESREHLFALYAFNIEIAKTREVVTEPLLGRMRLQWWRDALESLYAGKSIAHEVARPLRDAIKKGQLDHANFQRLIDAREADLDETPPPDLAAYAEGTVAPLLELAIQIASGGKRHPLAADAARAIGTAWALTGLIRAIPFHASRHRLYLPPDRLEIAGVSLGRLFDLKPDAGLTTVVREIGEQAFEHLRTGRAAVLALPRNSRSPLLLAELAALYLRDLEKVGWNPFSPNLRRRNMAAASLAFLFVVKRY
jgi:NADH dehydrogenase [ubiquinone] 1 alpha subcomplex assembly factor 6